MNVRSKNQYLRITQIVLACLTIAFLANVACTSRASTLASNPPIITVTPSPTSPIPTPTQPPWLNIDVYTDETQNINIDAGDEFIVGFAIEYDFYPIIRETYDETVITLVDKKTISIEEQGGQRPIYVWFLFKALGHGATQLTIKHLLHIMESLHDQKIFSVVIR